MSEREEKEKAILIWDIPYDTAKKEIMRVFISMGGKP